MSLSATQYAEGQIRPMERPDGGGYDVWCATSALEVLRRREYVRWLADHPGEQYVIIFANGAAARIRLGYPLWEAMAEITKDYTVEVFQLTLRGKYIPWTGGPGSLGDFDAVHIKVRPR